MAEHYIGVFEGDGSGPELVREGVKVLNAVGEKYGHKFDLKYAPFGARAYFEYGHPFPNDTKKLVDDVDSIIKGPVGLPVEEMEKIQEGLRPEGAAILPLRWQLDAYANIRPIILPKAFADFSPLKERVIGDGIDIMMVRELVGGIYFGKKVEGSETNMEFAMDECKYTREQIERIAHVAFKEARRRNEAVNNIHKKNVLATSRFWNSVVGEVHRRYYDDVKLNETLVDAAAFYLTADPRRLNGVMLMSNMFGDILTDQGGGLLGSLGLVPSICYNPETGKGFVEPAHGAANDLAGKNVVNPYSMIGSVALMLDRQFGMAEEARDIWIGLGAVFGAGFRTRELATENTLEGKIISTTQFGDMVRNNILAEAA